MREFPKRAWNVHRGFQKSSCYGYIYTEGNCGQIQAFFKFFLLPYDPYLNFYGSLNVTNEKKREKKILIWPRSLISNTHPLFFKATPFWMVMLHFIQPLHQWGMKIDPSIDYININVMQSKFWNSAQPQPQNKSPVYSSLFLEFPPLWIMSFDTNIRYISIL